MKTFITSVMLICTVSAYATDVYINGVEQNIDRIYIWSKPKPVEPDKPPVEGPTYDFYDTDKDGILDFQCPGGVYDPNNYADTIQQAYACLNEE